MVSLYIIYLFRMEQKEIKALAEAKRREKAEARAAKYVFFAAFYMSLLSGNK